MSKLQHTATLIIVLGLVVLTTACGSNHEQEPAAPIGPPIQARAATVERISESQLIEVYGIVQPARMSFVSARVMGPVVSVRVDSGDTVRTGQTLIEIQPEVGDGQVAQAQGALAQARAALLLAERNLQRYASLHAENAASEVELDMARMQAEQARGAVSQAEGAVKAATSVAADAKVRAPFTARVVERLVEVGDMAAPGRPLVRIESLSGRKLWLTVREADITHLSQDQEIEVSLDTRSDLGVMTGTVDEIVPSADPATHTFTVKIDLGEVDVASGIAGRARVPGNIQERLVVPVTAVHQRGGLELVVTVAEDGTVRTRAVTVGRRFTDGRVEVLSGLRDGDIVLIDAPGPVADGTPVEVQS
jgi:RND family efflux transporter MFP subunit